jgi:hypothetical protein
MGPKPRHSSRQSKAGRSSSPKILPITFKPTRDPTDFDALLERFSDALSIVATAARSLSLTQADVQPIPGHDIGEDILTLETGVAALRAVYNDLDVAIREVRS